MKTYQKQELGLNEAFCLTCKQAIKMLDPVRKQEGRLYYYRCSCPHCGCKLARIITRAYLKYRAEVDQVAQKTIKLEETWLRQVLEWTNDKPFEQVSRIKPALPEYLLSARLDGKEGQLSPDYAGKVISSSKRFLEGLLGQCRWYYASVVRYFETWQAGSGT